VDKATAESISDVIAKVVGDVVGQITNTLISGTGLEQLLATDLMNKIDQRIGDLAANGAENLKSAMMNFAINQLLSQFALRFHIVPVDMRPSDSGILTLSEQVKKDLQLIANDTFAGILDVNQFINFLKGNWQQTLIDNAKNALKKAGKVITTAALDALSNWAGTKLKSDSLEKAHVITTHAIAGAGASNVGIAGAVALSIVDGKTVAAIGDSDDLTNIDLTGTLTLFAQGVHDEDTVASAAVGDDGNPDTNPSAGGDSDVGNGSANSSAGTEVPGSNGKLVIGNTTNGKITSLEKPYEDEDVFRIKVRADEGYKLTGLTLTRSDSGQTLNVNITGGVFDAVTEEWTFTYTLSGEALKDDAVITAMALFAGDNKKLTVTSAAHGKAVTGDAKGTTISEAKQGDKVLVTVTPDKGYTLDSLKYQYTVDGKTELKDVVTYEKVGGNVLAFYMPGADVTVIPYFRLLNAGEQPMDTTGNTTASGKSVGVGASFAMTYSDMSVIAGIGENNDVSAAAADIRTEGYRDTNTVSVAGTDPLSGTDGVSEGNNTTATTDAKDIALDASAALSLLDNTVRSYIAATAKLTTTGTDSIILDEAEVPVENTGDMNAETETVTDALNVYLHASQEGYTLTKASGFAVGDSAAVGASVAVNIVDSDVKAEFLGTGVLSGKARIAASSHNEDDSYGIATAMGASLDRYLQKFRVGTDKAEKVANEVAQGNYDSLTANANGNKDNKTADKANEKLNGNADANGGTANNSMPLSSNALKTQNAKTGSTPDDTSKKGLDNANGKVDGGVANTAPTQQSQSVQVAASVALNVTNHKAIATVGGNISANALQLLSDNEGNFRTRATGASMASSTGANPIAAAVAISVNNNEAIAEANGDITTSAAVSEKAGDPSLKVQAELTQNMSGEYRGALGAQAIAGAISMGTGGKAAVSGAIATIVSNAKTRAAIGSNATLTGGDIEIVSYDKSKLALRAGGVSLSNGSTVGVGASFALLYGNNTVETVIGDNVTIKGRNLTVSAVKDKVTFGDFVPTIDLSYLFTDSTGLESTDTSERGIIDIKKDVTAANKGYTVTINISTDKVLAAVDLLNFLSSNNYYAEAIAGTIVGGASSTAAVAGSMAMIFYEALTEVLIGNGVTLEMTGDAIVEAKDEATARIISGSLSASPATVGVGVTIAALANDSTVKASVGDDAVITAKSFAETAESTNDFMVITVAAALSNSASGTATVGGTLNVIAMNNEATASVGENSSITTTGGDVSVKAKSDSYLLLPSFSVSVSMGKVAAGGTIAVIVSETDTAAKVGNNTTIRSAGAVTVEAVTLEKLISVLASVSAAPSGTVGAAGTVSALVSLGTTTAQVGDNVKITALRDVAVKGVSDSTMVVIGMAAAGASTVGVGGTVIVNVFERDLNVLVGSGAALISTDGNVTVEALAEDMELIIGFALGASAGSAGIAGVIPVTVSLNEVKAEVGSGAVITAGDSIGVIANLDSGVYIVSGAIGAASTAGAGAAVSTAVLQNTVEALVAEDAALTANGKLQANINDSGLKLPNRKERRRGVVVSATGEENMLMISVSGAGGGTAGVAGVINTLVAGNTYRAKVDGATLNASGSEVEMTVTENGGESEKYTSFSDVAVEASDETFILDLAGGLGAGGTAGVGATVVVLVFDKTVEAILSGTASSDAGDVTVDAKADDDLWLLAIAFGAGGTAGVAGDVNTLVFENEVTASLGSVEKARNVRVNATADSNLYNIGIGGAGAGTAGVTAVAVVTYFKNITKAYIQDNAEIGTAAAPVTGSVDVTAVSNEFVTADAGGFSGAGVAGVGGTLDVVVNIIKTEAYIGSNAKVYAKGDVNVRAIDTYELVAVVVTVSGSGTAAVAVTALVSVSFNTVSAVIGENAVVSGRNVNVEAISNRDAVTTVATVTGSGIAAVGVSLSVVVFGNKLPQDAHDTLYGGMDPDAQVKGSFDAGHSAAKGYQPTDDESLAVLLAGDGQKQGQNDYSEYGQDTGSTPYTENADGSVTVSSTNKQTAAADGHKVTASPVAGLSDSTTARVNKNANVIATENINVLATDAVSANMVTGTAGAAGAAGVGVGLSAAALFSNVAALVEDDAVLTAGGKVKVHASTGASDKVLSESKVENASLNQNSTMELLDKQDIEVKSANRIRLIGIMGSGGIAGVGVGGAILLVFSDVKAILAGDVEKAAGVEVAGDMVFGEVLTVHTGVAAGVAGVNVSAGVAYFGGKVETGIAGDAKLENITGPVSVKTNGSTNVNSSVANLAGGVAAVNAGVALSINDTKVNTYIGRGVTLNAAGRNVNVDTKFSSEAMTNIISASFGGVAVGASVAIAINRLHAETYIGTAVNSGHAVKGDNASVSGGVTAKDITVASDVAGETMVNVLGLGGGAVAVNGAVALGFNRAKGIAAVNKANITAEDLTVNATMDGDVMVNSAAVTAGGAAVGATVAVAEQKTDNRALVDTTGSTVKLSGDLTLNAGTAAKPYNSDAQVNMITGTAGNVAAALNFAVALNESGNRAVVQGIDGILDANDVFVNARGNAHAYAVVGNASAGGVAANVSLSYADISAVQEAIFATDADTTLTGGLEAVSYQNQDKVSGNLILDYKNNTYDKNIAKSALAEAYIFSASLGVATAAANTAIANADATGRAKVAGRNLSVGKGITVLSRGLSKAVADIDNLSSGLASLGVMVGYAYANGTFEALLESKGSITANGDVTVDNKYESTAKTEITPANGGVDVNYYAGKVNVGYAEVETGSKAGISGSGTLKAQDVSVVNTGTALSDASVKGGYLTFAVAGMTSNTVVSRLAAEQEAYIKGVFVEADSAKVLSRYNVGTDLEPSYNNTTGLINIPEKAENTGAIAAVGASYADVSGVNVKVNVADAKSESTVKAYVDGAGSLIEGALDVHTLATTYAETNIDKPTASVSLANVGVGVLTSNAGGTYEAYINTASPRSEGLKAGSIRVGVGHNTDAKATTGPLGGKGGSVGGISINTNRATANADAKANAYLTGKGSVAATKGDLTVQSYGKILADAAAITDVFSIDLLNVAASETFANVAMKQNVYMNVNGDVTVAGSLDVRSEATAADSGAYAKSGTPGTSGAQISLVSGGGTTAKATSELTNKAYISGSGTIRVGGDASVRSNADTLAKATVNKPFSAALAEVTVLLASAAVKDTIEAYVSGVALNAGGKVDVLAKGNATADSTSASGGGASLVSGAGGNTEATVGSKSKPQTVKAYIGSNADVTAVKDITVKAENDGSAKARMTAGFKVSAIGINAAVVPTVSYYRTEASVGSNSSLKSTAGSITVKAIDHAAADTLVDGNSAGIVVSASSKYAENTVDQTTAVTVGTNANLWAHGSIRVETDSNAKMLAKTNANSGGIFDGGTLQAHNTLKRDVDTKVLDGATLFADFGSIDIISRAGEKDDIETWASGNSAGIVTIGNVKANTYYTSSSDVTVGGGVTITNTFGDVNIQSHNSAAKVKTEGDIGSVSLGGDTDAEANLPDRDYSTEFTLASRVNVAKDASRQAKVTARNIDVKADLVTLAIHNYSYASTKGFLNFAHAYSDVHFYLDVATTVGNAHLNAYDSLSILADGMPDNSGNHLYIKADTKITAFAGRVESYARLYGSADVAVSVMNGARLTGADVRIDRNAFNGNTFIDAVGTRKAIASEKEEEVNDLTKTAATNVGSGVIFDIGDAAAGIAIDVYEEDGTNKVRSVGTNSTFTYNYVGGGIRFSNIANVLPGKLTVIGNANGLENNVIYGQQYIHTLTITNRTDLDLVLQNVDLFNETFTHATVNALNLRQSNSYNKSKLGVSENTVPRITVESRGRGDVTFAGLVANERGSLTVVWTEENKGEDDDEEEPYNGSLYTVPQTIGSFSGVAPIWVHELNIENAHNIGTSETDRFHAYLAVFDGEDARINVTATGNAYLALTLTEIACVNKLSDAPLSGAAIAGTLDLNSIVTKGDLDILLPTALRMEYLADSRVATVVIPGAIQFTTETLDLGEVTISAEELQHYMLGAQTGAYRIYTLPNGTQLYLDENGFVRRIISAEGHSLDTSLYSINGSVITFHEYGGMTLNLATGVLTAGEGGYELYVVKDDKGWYTLNGSVDTKDEMLLYLVEEDTYKSESISSLHLWKSHDGVTYYFITEDDYNNRTNTDHDKYYVLAIESGTNYLLGVYEGVRKDGEEKYDVNMTLSSTTTSAPEADGSYTRTLIYTGSCSDSAFATTSYGFSATLSQTVTEKYDKDGKLLDTVKGEITVSATLAGWSGFEPGKNYYYGSTENGSLAGYRVWTPTAATVGLNDSRARVTVRYNYIDLTAMSQQDIVLDKGEDGEKGTDDDVTANGYVINDGDKTWNILLNTVYEFTDVNGYRGTDEDGNPKKYVLQSAETASIIEWVEKKIGFVTFRIPRLKIATEATIKLEEGQSITLADFRYEGLDVYRVSKDLLVSVDGKIIKNVWDRDEDGTFLDQGAHTQLRYDLNSGDSSVTRFKEDGKTAESSLAYDKASGSAAMRGQQHLLRMSETVAQGANGKYYFYTSGVWKEATSVSTFAGEANVTITNDIGIVVMTIHSENGVTYHTEYRGGSPYVRVGSDGSVHWFDETVEESIKQAEIPGTDYSVKELEGSSVKLTVKDPEGSLLDGDTGNDDADITATEGDVIISMNSTGTLGEDTNPLDIVTRQEDGRLILVDENGEPSINMNTYIYVPEGDLELDPFTKVVGSELVIVLANGNLIGYDLLVEKDENDRGSVTILTNQLEVRENGKVTGFTENTAATAAGNIFFHNIKTIGSDILFGAAGSITVEEDLDWYTATGNDNRLTPEGIKAEDSRYTWTAEGDITVVGGIHTKDSELTMAAGGSFTADQGTTESAVAANGTIANVTAAEDVTIVGGIETAESEITVTAENGSFTLGQGNTDKAIAAEKSNITVTAAEDAAIVGGIEAAESEITVTAENGSFTLEQGTADKAIAAEKSSITVTVAEDAAIVGGIEAKNESSVSITAENGSFTLEQGTADKAIAAEKSSITVTAAEDASITGGIEATEAEITVTAENGSFTLEQGTAENGLDAVNSTVTVNAGADASITGMVKAEGSIVNIHAQSGSFKLDKGSSENAVDSTSSDVTVTAGTDLTLIGNMKASGSRIDLDAVAGTVTADKVGSVSSDILWTAGKDILFDSIIAKESDVILEAGEDIAKNTGIECGEYGVRAFIKFADTDTDANSTLSLSAKGAIASEDSRLIVDIPAAVTLQIPAVGDIHIDSLDLILGNENAEDPTKYDEVEVGDTPIPGVDIVTHPDNPKVNEFNGYLGSDRITEVDGDHLKEIEAQFLEMALSSQSPAELAAWIMERADRENWTEQLNAAVVESLLGLAKEEGFDPKWIAELMGAERIFEILGEDCKAELANEVRKMQNYQLERITSLQEAAAELTEEDLKEIFAGLTDAQKKKAGLDPKTATAITGAQVARLADKSAYMGIKWVLRYLEDDFLAALALRVNGRDEAAVEEILAEDSSIVYDAIFGTPDGAITAEDAENEPNSAEKAPASGNGYETSYAAAKAVLTKLLELQLTKIKTADAEGNTVFADGPESIPNLDEYLGSLLTEEDIEELYRAAIDESRFPEDEEQLEDSEAKELTVTIGESTGTTYLYNDGSITVTQNTGDLTAGEITSERGNVTVTAENGSILAGEAVAEDGHHILGRDITLTAAGDVGTQSAPLKLEQRENSPEIVVGVEEEMYFDGEYADKRADGETEFEPTETEKKYVLRQVEVLDEEGNVVLDKNGAPIMKWILDVVVRYDWVRVDDPDPEPRMELTVNAGNDAFVEELTGSVAGSIIAGGNADLTVNDGEVGTYEDPFVTDVDGTITVNARDDISISDPGDLDLIANSENGQVNAEAAGDIDLSNNNGEDLVIGPVISESGDVSITADGDLVEGDRYEEDAQVQGENISLKADGAIGTEDDPFDVDTGDAGTLSAEGAELVINETSGDLTVEKIIATEGDVTITVPGSIEEAGNAGAALEDAAEADKEADAAEDKANAAEDKAGLLDEYAGGFEQKQAEAEEATEKAEQALEDAKDRIGEIEDILKDVENIRADDTLSEEEKQAAIEAILGDSKEDALHKELETLSGTLPQLEEALKQAEEAEEAAKAKAEEARKIADDAKAEADAARAEADLKRQEADKALEEALKREPTVQLPGDLDITAGGSIGSEDAPLSVEVGGDITAEAPEGVHIAGYGDMNIKDITSENEVTVSGSGDITGSGNGPHIDAPAADINSLGGSAGTEKDPLKLDVDSLSGSAKDDFVAENDGDLEIGSITAGGKADLEVDGSVTGTSGETPNISAEELELKAEGSIGTKEDPIRVNADKITVDGRDIDLDIGTDTTIHQIRGDEITINAAGDVFADPETPEHDYHIIGDSLELIAQGNVGTEEEPLRIWVPGEVKIESVYGDVYCHNYYEPEQEILGTPTTGGEEDLTLILSMFAAAALLFLLARRRRKENAC